MFVFSSTNPLTERCEGKIRTRGRWCENPRLERSNFVGGACARNEKEKERQPVSHANGKSDRSSPPRGHYEFAYTIRVYVYRLSQYISPSVTCFFYLSFRLLFSLL